MNSIFLPSVLILQSIQVVKWKCIKKNDCITDATVLSLGCELKTNLQTLACDVFINELWSFMRSHLKSTAKKIYLLHVLKRLSDR